MLDRSNRPRRSGSAIAPGAVIHLPSIEDLITTKRWASRPRDIIDIQYLERLLHRKGGA
jgi:hypothetical protein